MIARRKSDRPPPARRHGETDVRSLASPQAAGSREAPRERLAQALVATRRRSVDLARPLSAEDQVVQSMPDASPTKWHLAHTSWFFETFILVPFHRNYRVFDEAYGYLFNSYYEAVGARHPRPERGLLTRPGAGEVNAYRRHVDAAMSAFMNTAEAATWAKAEALVALGIAHEEQHQELMLTDILSVFARNPLRPAYRAADDERPQDAGRGKASDGDAAGDDGSFLTFPGGLYEIGHADGDGDAFAFDNEGPRHKVYLEPFRLAARPVSNGAWMAFIEDGGYRRPELWLADGWAVVQAEGWASPLYWERDGDGRWAQMSLRGLAALDACAPVCHVGLYEADAFARWAGMRLPSEAEWEVAASTLDPSGNTLGAGRLRPCADDRNDTGAPSPVLRQMFGDVWEWTASSYAPYPGFRPAAGAVGEYNGKFMCNQMVLRGGSCATPDGHVRPTYRNFFYPHQRWQFSGVRLAQDV
ncbi:MAG: ergothioneine biosynthesis protein EgtB [Rhodospirillales bacterium]|nr:ergothioneine biosynthesis protein EgtB [Rhodospirillales bacterium]